MTKKYPVLAQNWVWCWLQPNGELSTIDGMRVLTEAPLFKSLQEARVWCAAHTERHVCLGADKHQKLRPYVLAAEQGQERCTAVARARRRRSSAG